MMAYYDLEAMLVTDWDDGCTVKLYDGKSLMCEGDVIVEYSKEQAQADNRMSDEGFMCLTNLAGEMGPYYAAYVCE